VHEPRAGTLQELALSEHELHFRTQPPSKVVPAPCRPSGAQQADEEEGATDEEPAAQAEEES
jgi:hypothetical protein